MRERIKRLCRGLHRILCGIGLHAPDVVFRFDDKLADFVPDGWYCAVCNKDWEK